VCEQGRPGDAPHAPLCQVARRLGAHRDIMSRQEERLRLRIWLIWGLGIVASPLPALLTFAVLAIIGLARRR